MSVSLQPGKVLEGRKASYELVERLGGGKYAEVWKARGKGVEDPSLQEVALKSMRPGLLEPEKQAFWSEVEVLQGLHRYEDECDLRVEGVSLLPEVLDANEHATPPFFVETLAQGSPLDALFREKGVLSEPDALLIISQLLRVFQILHEGLQKSYHDFQPRNVFWDPEARRILVIDWNLLSKGRPAFAQDLETAAGLLYRVLMGVPIPRPGARRPLKEPGERWDSLSLGTQDILVKAFHVDPKQRYGSAKEFREEVEKQLEAWQKGQRDPSELLQEAEKLAQEYRELLPRYQEFMALAPGYREPAEGMTKKAKQVANYVSIIRKVALGPQRLSWEGRSSLEKLEEDFRIWLDRRDMLWQGIAHFQSRGYEAAQQEMERVRTEALEWMGNPLVGWQYLQVALEASRWEQAAEAILQAREIYQQWTEEDKQQLQKALEHLGKERYDEAEKILEDLRKWYPVSGPSARPRWLDKGESARGEVGEAPSTARGLSALRNECEVWLKWREVEHSERRGHFEQAAQDLQEVQEILNTLPSGYRGVLQQALGDLQERKRALEEEAERLRELQKKVEGLRGEFQKDWASGFEKAREELDQWAGVPPESLVNLLKKEIERQLDAYQWMRARALAALGADYVGADEEREEFTALWKGALCLIHAEEAVRERDWKGFLHHVRAAREEFPDHARGAVEKWLRDLLGKAVQEQDYPTAEAVARVLSPLSPSDSERLQKLREELEGQKGEILQGLKDALAKVQLLLNEGARAAGDWEAQARQGEAQAQKVLEQAEEFLRKSGEIARAPGSPLEQDVGELRSRLGELTNALEALEEWRAMRRRELWNRLKVLWPVATGDPLPEELEALAPSEEPAVRSGSEAPRHSKELQMLALREAEGLLDLLRELVPGPEQQNILGWREKLTQERLELEPKPTETLGLKPELPPPQQPGALRYLLVGAGGMGLVGALLLAGAMGYFLGGGRLLLSTPTPTFTKTPVPTATLSPTPAPTSTFTPVPTPTPTPTLSPTPTDTPAMAAETPEGMPEATTPAAEQTPSPEATHGTPTPVPTPTPTLGPTPTDTPAPETPTPVPTVTPSSTGEEGASGRP